MMTRRWRCGLALTVAGVAALAVLSRLASGPPGATEPSPMAVRDRPQATAAPSWSILRLAFEFASIDAGGAAAPQFVQREEIEDASPQPVHTVVLSAMLGATRLRAYVDGKPVPPRRVGPARVSIPVSLAARERRWVALSYVLRFRGSLPWAFAYTLARPVSGGVYLGTLAQTEPYLMVRSDEFRRDPAADNRVWRGWLARGPFPAGETLRWRIIADSRVPYPAAATPSPPPRGHSFLPPVGAGRGGA